MARGPEAAVIQRRRGGVEARRALLGAVLKLLVALGAGAALLSLVFGVGLVRGAGMEPTMGDGDVVLFYRLSSDLQADDLVVYDNGSGEQVIGRVVAQPGDTVEVTEEGDFLLNGTRQPSLQGEATLPSDSGPSYPLTLAEGEYFVLGDGRSDAVDSRELGPIGSDEVEGVVMALLRLRGI